jgi:GNAT superfamily N-acetyltransferase
MKKDRSEQIHRQDVLFKLYKSDKTIPKDKWEPEALLNTAIEKCVWDDESNHYVYLTTSDESYASKVNLFLKRLWNKYKIEVVSACVNYEQIIFVPKKLDDKIYKIPLFGDVVYIKCDRFTMTITPYCNGINVLGICVNDKFRNKGIGTDVINTLYDVSEERDIAIFLNPYPDEKCAVEEIWDRVYRLRHWYTKLGFGMYRKMEWLWCNYEDKHADEFIINNK